jgi:hypothetical protein
MDHSIAMGRRIAKTILKGAGERADEVAAGRSTSDSASPMALASEIPGLGSTIDPRAWQPVACGLCGSSERRLKFQDGPSRS